MQEYTVRVYTSGDTEWRQNGQRHRTDGPAREWSNGIKEWYLNGQRHRTDGPAVEWACGYKAWYIEGKRYSEEQFNQKINPICTKTVVIDGVEYELVKK